MNQLELSLYLTAYQNEYKQFVGMDKLPLFDTQTREMSLMTADARGYDSAAISHYNPKTQKHILTFSSNVEPHKQLVYHEFTHMVDAELYASGDPLRYAMLSGFSEYHASQIELMKLLGAKTVNEKISFSMSTIINTIMGNKTVSQYVEEKRLHAVALFKRGDFPADLAALKSAMGVLFNYFGLRSVCKMYATDYSEKIDNAAFLNHISVLQFAPVNKHMHGWLDKDSIEISMKMYWGIMCSLMQVNKFM